MREKNSFKVGGQSIPRVEYFSISVTSYLTSWTRSEPDGHPRISVAPKLSWRSGNFTSYKADRIIYLMDWKLSLIINLMDWKLSLIIYLMDWKLSLIIFLMDWKLSLIIYLMDRKLSLIMFVVDWKLSPIIYHNAWKKGWTLRRKINYITKLSRENPWDST